MSTLRPSTASFAVVWWVASVSVAVAAAATGCASETSADRAPASALAQTRQAQEAFHGIEEQWRASAAERAAVEASLREFMQHHPGDGRSQLAKSYLAWLHLERGDAPAARALAAEARKGPRGVARDLADIVEAGVARRMGDPRLALSLLGPLTDRVIDPQHRLFHARELTEAVIAAERWTLVPRALRGQIDAARANGVDSRADVRLTLDSLPRPALGQAFDQLRKLESTHEEHRWLFNSIWRRLASLAIADKDSGLARVLLEDHGRVSPNAFELEALRRLAARHDVAPRALGRRLGLLLEPGDRTVRSRSAEAAAGAVAALDLAAQTSGGVRLVSRVRQDGESVADALQALRSQGAALLIAGVTSAAATDAMRFAEQHRVGVVLLTRPESMPPHPSFTYLVGPQNVGEPDSETDGAPDGEVFDPAPSAPAGVGLYEALGHDAVVLAAGSLAKLDAPTTADPELVERFQLRAAERLGSVQAELWSTKARGFDGGRVLQRERPPGEASDP